ncbi:hypothetical protein Taro_039949 [Colocasia esculenta]|uniref:Uncharacterized protein n=1 Tax=Colocasia esculenta TaxID=4460 RepID=A0A843WT04_COLES|nr:hypothetical protein [Colocasia esculenta]
METPKPCQVLSCPPHSSRYHRNGKGNRDKRVASWKHVMTTRSRHDLIAMATHAVIRSHPTGAMPPLMSRPARRSRHQLEGRPSGCYIPRSPTHYKTHNHGEGSMVKAVKAKINLKGLPINLQVWAQEIPTGERRTNPQRGLHVATATSSSLHDDTTMLCMSRRCSAKIPPPERKWGKAKQGEGIDDQGF